MTIPQDWLWLLVPILLGIGGYYWQRRGVIEQSEPDLPAIEGLSAEWLNGADGWCQISFAIRNFEKVRWYLDDARVTLPVGAKITATVPLLPPPNEWTPGGIDLARLDPNGLTNSCRLAVDLAPAGTHSGTLIMGLNSVELQSLWVFVPPRSEDSSLSIILTLRSSAFDDRTFSRMLAQNISDIAVNPNQ